MAISQICRKMNFCDGICLSRTFWFYTPQAFIWLPGNSFKALEIKIIREKTWLPWWVYIKIPDCCSVAAFQFRVLLQRTFVSRCWEIPRWSCSGNPRRKTTAMVRCLATRYNSSLAYLDNVSSYNNNNNNNNNNRHLYTTTYRKTRTGSVWRF